MANKRNDDFLDSLFTAIIITSVFEAARNKIADIYHWFVPETDEVPSRKKPGEMTEEDYKKEKEYISLDAKISKIIIAVTAIIMFIGLLISANSDSGGGVLGFAICLAVLGGGALYFNGQEETDQEWLDKEYNKSQQKKEQEQKAIAEMQNLLDSDMKEK